MDVLCWVVVFFITVVNVTCCVLDDVCMLAVGEWEDTIVDCGTEIVCCLWVGYQGRSHNVVFCGDGYRFQSIYEKFGWILLNVMHNAKA